MRLACVQTDVVFGDPDANSRHACEVLDDLSARGVELAVFPEAFLTGYCVDSSEEACRIAVRRDHPALRTIAKAGIACVVGFAERLESGVANSAVLIEPGEAPRFYTKTHLPHLGFDRFATAGDELPVFDTKVGKIGVLVCFDLRYPEAARTLTLKGAEILVLPTNWPEGAEVSAEHVAITRAAENRVFVATCNRVGSENGFTFIGRSKIIGPTGQVLASAGSGAEIIVADIDPSVARNKRNVTIPGAYETDVVGCRRPSLYEV